MRTRGAAHRHCPPPKSIRRKAQSLVHWHDEVSRAQNPKLVTQRLVESLTQGDPNVLHRMVVVHIQLALGVETKIEAAMPSKQFQHMVEESNAGGNLVPSSAIDVQRKVDASLVGVALDASLPHATTSGVILSSAKTSRSAAKSCSVCASEPRVMRTQPSQPGSEERSRTRIPRSFMAATNAACFEPIWANTKLAWLGQYAIPRDWNSRSRRTRPRWTWPTY